MSGMLAAAEEVRPDGWLGPAGGGKIFRIGA
jgi:hypothetical protein